MDDAMGKKSKILIVLLLIVCSFAAGYWINNSGRSGGAKERKILYYVDPMNPALKSDKPGIAPCGMPLEPVYADQSDSADAAGKSLPGTIRISPEKQQLIGVKVAAVA